MLVFQKIMRTYLIDSPLRLRDAAFEMQLIFHVRDSGMKLSPFLCSKTIFIKNYHNKKKRYNIFIYSYY